MAEQLNFGDNIIEAVQVQSDMLLFWQQQCKMSPTVENFDRVQRVADALISVMQSAQMLQEIAANQE